VAPSQKKGLPGRANPLSEDETASISLRTKDRVQEVLDYHARRSPREKYGSRTKTIVNIRIDNDVLDHFKSLGDDWRDRINDVLRKAGGLDRKVDNGD
jgi:uncharacterized protein (DUF4415 family)